MEDSGLEIVNIRTIYMYTHTAYEFADNFKNKFAKIRLEIADAALPTFHLEPPAVMQQFKAVTVLEVVELIGMSPCKHSDLDPVTTWLLKKESHILGLFLALLFNLSLQTKEFPTEMKRATIVPFLKKTSLDSDDMSNYGPVSNLSFVSKLLERIVSKQIMEYMETHNLLLDHQSAYRAGHSCETAILRVQSDLIEAAYSGNVSLIALLDLSSAFDCVDHDILLQRLTCDFDRLNQLLAG